MHSVKHWGELTETEQDEHIPDITLDIERSMDRFYLNEFDNEDDTVPKTERIIVPPLNPLILYGISLHKYANNLVEMIKLSELTNEMNLVPPPEEIDLKMPEMPKVNIRHKRNNLNYVPKDFTDFTSGQPVEVPDLSKNVVRQILTKCAATMFAHIGYERSQQSALDVLTDALESFLKKISSQLKIALEDEEKHSASGFPYAIERVLTEMGFGGIKGLNEYYQCRVIKYITVLQNRCKDLNQEYQALMLPRSTSPVDKINKVVRVKVEEEDVVETENPEVHFSTIDGDVNFSILETGYQLLNSLEAETNLQTLGETEEDISTSESPSVISLPESDVSHLSPFSKKKRFR